MNKMSLFRIICDHDKQQHFILSSLHCSWKDMKNPFRLDKNAHLSVIPTMINWNEKTKRLEGDQLCKPELLEMFFETD